MIRILFVDDHALFRQGLRNLLLENGNFEIVAECSDSMTAIDQIRALQPDVALVDISMPEVSGVALLQHLRKEGNSTPIIMLTMHEDPIWCRRAVDAGANGYLLKGEAFDELFTGIKLVLSGQKYISKRITTTEESPLSQLSVRELEILQLVCQGKSNRMIAEELFISIKTVDTHRTKVMKKLNLHTTADLVRRTTELGIF
jgi:DNA-binding NarL/FixJ family response regulator